MRVALIVIACLLTSCGQDSPESRISGSWRMGGASTTTNMVNMTLAHDDKTITGIADVNSMVYDLDGSWEGPLGPDEVFQLDISVTVGQTALQGDGTVSSGGEAVDVAVAGSRRGRSFQFSVSPEAGDTLEVSGGIKYNYRDFGLTVDVQNIAPVTEGGDRRNLHLTVTGTARGGGLDLFQ